MSWSIVKRINVKVSKNVENEHSVLPNISRLRVCMLAYTFYETDGRVMRYAEALADVGADVEAIVLRREGQDMLEIINKVKVCRIQERIKNESGKFSYFFRIIKFFFRSMVAISWRHFKNPYDLIHVHSVPDFEVFATVLPKMFGVKVILDIHDIVPEFYAAKFKVGENSLIFKSLKLIEKLSAAFSNHVIIANELWLKKITHRSVNPAKCSAYINYPDLSIFDRHLKLSRADGKFIMIYPGTLNHHQGLDIAINAVYKIAPDAPSLELHIYGEGSAVPGLQELISALKLTDKVFLKSPLPLREIAKIMANADLGVVPKRNDSFGGDAFSTKILEFMALGVPVICSDTRVDRHYFNDTLLRFFNAGDVDDLAKVILQAYKEPHENRRLTDNALKFAEQNSWDVKKYQYLDLIQSLVPRLKESQCV
jgi:glycosyltransferase involved in cell wall biosynthesis